MSRFFAEMETVLERHGGTVEKFIGDAVMAVFSIPVVHEDDALRVVRTAAEMRDALATLNVGLERDFRSDDATRIAVNTGGVVAGDSSAGQRLVTGDAVNIAARRGSAAPDRLPHRGQNVNVRSARSRSSRMTARDESLWHRPPYGLG